MDFVTGGTGLVGMHLVHELLLAGRSVRALCRPNSQRERLENFLAGRGVDSSSRVEWVEGTIDDVFSLESGMEGCERVFHAAGLVSFHPGDADLLMQVNRNGTQNVVNAMLHKGLEQLVYISSVAALGRKEGQPVHEEMPFEDGPNTTGYARSKFAAELEVWRGQEEGLKVIALHPVVVIGEGDFSRSSSIFFPMIDRGLQWHPSGSNGFVAAADVARAAVITADQEFWGQRFVLCGVNMSYQRLFASIADTLGVSAPRRPVRPWMMQVAWRLSSAWEKITRRRARVTRESIMNTHLNHRYETDLLERTLANRGISWQYTEIQRAIEDAVRGYKISVATRE